MQCYELVEKKRNTMRSIRHRERKKEKKKTHESSGSSRERQSLLCRDGPFRGRFVALVRDEDERERRIVGRHFRRRVVEGRFRLAHRVDKVGHEFERLLRIDRVPKFATSSLTGHPRHEVRFRMVAKEPKDRKSYVTMNPSPSLALVSAHRPLYSSCPAVSIISIVYS